MSSNDIPPPEEKSRKGWFARLLSGERRAAEEKSESVAEVESLAGETSLLSDLPVSTEFSVAEVEEVQKIAQESESETSPRSDSSSGPEFSDQQERGATDVSEKAVVDASVDEGVLSETEPVVDMRRSDGCDEEIDEPKNEHLIMESPSPVPVELAKKGWLARLKEGLGRSSSRLGKGITDLFTKRRLDDEALEDLEDLLISADLGVETARRVAQRLSKSRFGQEVTPQEIRVALADEIADILAPVAEPLVPDPSCKPYVVLVAGVNGSGKTTTIGKMAKYYSDQGLKVSLVAGDTFRAAAVEQLRVWGERCRCPVIARDQGADAAGLTFDALSEAQNRGDDLLLIDTAGRLQNKKDLMAELQKIVRVLQKKDPATPHATLLVLDATVGQNAHSQVETFKEMVNVTGLILTKLDGTARGGVLVALAERFALPVHAIGVGESAEDLRPFDPRVFARSLTGVE